MNGHRQDSALGVANIYPISFCLAYFLKASKCITVTQKAGQTYSSPLIKADFEGVLQVLQTVI